MKTLLNVRIPILANRKYNCSSWRMKQKSDHNNLSQLCKPRLDQKNFGCYHPVVLIYYTNKFNLRSDKY